MPQIFNRSTNAIARLSIWGAVFVLAGVAWAASVLNRSAYNTNQGVTIKQPIPFGHEHHVAGLGIDCRYCHSSVEKSASAGIPPTATCMNCHKLVWNDSPMLAPVRESFRTGRPLNWAKVYDLPDFVYFDHSIHINRGVVCNNCHGPVNQMPITWKGRDFRMMWCLECHEDPSKFLYKDKDQPAGTTPRQQVFNFYRKLAAGDELTAAEKELAEGLPQLAPADKTHEGVALMKERGVNVSQLKDCYVCHH